MSDKIEVYVNGKKLSIYRGMKVKHALIAYDQSIYNAALEGEIRILDANGFQIDLDGSLASETRIYTLAPNHDS